MKFESMPKILPLGAGSGRFDAACRVIDSAIAARAFPGCAFGVFAGRDIVLQGSRGQFTYEADSPVVETDTVFDIASVTKAVATTAAAMLLYQRGQLPLDTLLADLLPEFAAGRAHDDTALDITVGHLLAHNSGLPGYVELFRSALTPTVLMSACLRLTVESAPGAHATYSDPGFILLGKALEVILKESLASWTQREIFEPLGMSETGFCPAGPFVQRLIPPTEQDTWFRHRKIQGEVQDENAWVLGGVAGHAGVFSCVPDLLRFSAAVLGCPVDIAGGGMSANLFDRETVEVFATRQPPEGSSRALGWDTPSQMSQAGKYFSPHSIGHLGYSGCSLWIDLDAGIAVALLTNRTWPDRTSQLIREVRPAFHDAVRKAL